MASTPNDVTTAAGVGGGAYLTPAAVLEELRAAVPAFGGGALTTLGEVPYRGGFLGFKCYDRGALALDARFKIGLILSRRLRADRPGSEGGIFSDWHPTIREAGLDAIAQMEQMEQDRP